MSSRALAAERMRRPPVPTCGSDRDTRGGSPRRRHPPKPRRTRPLRLGADRIRSSRRTRAGGWTDCALAAAMPSLLTVYGIGVVIPEPTHHRRGDDVAVGVGNVRRAREIAVGDRVHEDLTGDPRPPASRAIWQTTAAMLPPALHPHTASLPGSPPRADALAATQRTAATRSSTAPEIGPREHGGS